MDAVQKIIDAITEKIFPPEETPDKQSKAAQFVPVDAKSDINEKDLVVIDMLNSSGHEHVCYCVCDPDLPDCPIIFASDGFCSFTGYERNEIEGKNCRFLQGKDTLPEDVDKIRKAIREETQTHVNLLNYRKDGSTFNNEFFISPIRKASDETKILYYLGVQTSVPKLGPGQMPSNPGWVYSQGSHV